MNRKEFLRQRAIADHVKKKGVVKVEAGEAFGATPIFQGRTHFHKHASLTHRKAAHDSLEPKIESESGEAAVRTSSKQWND